MEIPLHGVASLDPFFATEESSCSQTLTWPILNAFTIARNIS